MNTVYHIKARTYEEFLEKKEMMLQNEDAALCCASLEWEKEETYYDFDCLLSEEYKKYTDYDEWGVATLWLNDKQGVEYNFCMDGGHNSCAIYKMYYDEETGTESTDYSVFEHYEIDFGNVNWKMELEKAMYEVAKKFFEK